jgi:hypothetical protein
MINKMISLRNKLDFNIRQLIRWKRSGLRLSRVPKSNVFNHFSYQEKKQAKEIESRLLRTYDLQDIVERGDEDNYRINLYYLELMEKAFDQLDAPLSKEIKLADIGCSSWFYVRGLYGFLSGWRMEGSKRRVDLTGYEIDAFRPYFDLYSRFDYARVFSERLANTRYVSGAFSRQDNTFDVICQFFPFIFQKDHLEWGLPGELFFPTDLLRDAWLSLKKNGVLLVVNQGLEEHTKQKELFAQLGIKAGVSFKVDSVLFHYGIEHYVVGAIKNE